ncbi:MAG: hypothetical protein R2844_14010 [Caldilineales bacterium]
MNRVSITPVPLERNGKAYVAVAGDKQSIGKTAGEALDALTQQLGPEKGVTFVVVQSGQPDEFFTKDDQQRLAELMSSWRSARDQGATLPTDCKLNSTNSLHLNCAPVRLAQAMLDLLVE